MNILTIFALIVVVEVFETIVIFCSYLTVLDLSTITPYYKDLINGSVYTS